jgi:hypothetical protein
MSFFSQPVQGHRGHAVARAIAVLVLLGAALVGEPSRADPGDFQAMPGLWKIITRTFDHGHAGQPRVEWHCVDEGPDPWVEFASLTASGQAQCKRSDEHRSSTSLAWTQTCPGSAPATGRVDFDSPLHYTASLKLQGHDVVQVEGQRYAACTSPSD